MLHSFMAPDMAPNILNLYRKSALGAPNSVKTTLNVTGIFIVDSALTT